MSQEKTIPEVPASGMVKGESMSLKHESTATVLFHLLAPGKSTGVNIATYGGHNLDRSTSMTFVADFDDVVKACNGKAPAQLCLDCIKAYDAEVRAARRAKEEQEKEAAARRAREQEEREVIRKITGQELHPMELQDVLVAARRRGDDYTAYIDAMVAVDDLQVKRAGLTEGGDGFDD